MGTKSVSARILSSVHETKTTVTSGFFDGARETRTPDLLGAIQRGEPYRIWLHYCV
jgi:hypothetical protein